MPQLEGSENQAGKGENEPGAHNKFLNDSLNLVKEHKAEVAIASAAVLAVGTIALLKGKALPALGKEIGAVAKAREEDLLAKAAQHTDGLTPLLGDIRSAASAGRPGPIMNDAANAPENARSVTELSRALAVHPDTMPPPEWFNQAWTHNAGMRASAEYAKPLIQQPKGLGFITGYDSVAAPLKPEVVRAISAVTRALG